jgi:hypothetical protein
LKIRGEKVWYWLWRFKNELPRSELRGIQKIILNYFFEVVTSECFSRGASWNFAWIPAKSMRE